MTDNIMVSEQGRNNIIALAYIGGFAVVILTFFFNYVQQADKATQQIVVMVQRGVDNVTDAQYTQTGTILNLSKVVNGQLLLMEEEKETTKQNLKLFLDSFRNQSLDVQLEHQNQTNTIVQALHEEMDLIREQQNLTTTSQELLKQRLDVENRTADSLEALVALLNVTK